MNNIDFSKMTKAQLMAFKLSNNFSLFEMTSSDFATSKGICNVPNEQGVAKLTKLCTTLLQPIRDHFKVPVQITKGYIAPEINRQYPDISSDSAHCKCEAVDFTVQGVPYQTVIDWAVKNLNFDLVFPEYWDNDSSLHKKGYIHISLSPTENRKLNLCNIADQQKYPLSNNFSLYELVKSNTATALKIFNVPNEAGIEKLKLVCNKILQPVRDKLKKPVSVNSGFRSPALNSAVKGASKTSQHMKCEAVDYEIAGMKNSDLAKWVAQNLDYDQLILEFYNAKSGDPNSGWVHTSYKASGNRKMNLTISKA